jgi:DedD protein
MRGVFDEKEPEERGLRRETEFTLSTGAVLALFCGLALLCGLCFGAGYLIGHRKPAESVAASQPSASAQTSSQAEGSRPKPSATGQSGAATAPISPADQATDAANDSPATGAADTNAALVSPAPGSQGGSSAANSTPVGGQAPIRSAQVQPAVLPVPKPLQPAQPAPGPTAGSKVQPVAAPAVPLMVQIAAVSHVEDASVLVNALRKRGYTVTAQRKPEDDLIHVWIGPFSSRDEANKWRLKLLDDGYNAIVQP